MDPDLRIALARTTELLEEGRIFQAYQECRRLQGLIRAAFPPPILTEDHYANPELAIRLENTFPGWRMEVPEVDPGSPPTFTPILRFTNSLSITDDQCLIFAHDYVGSLGSTVSQVVTQNLREFLRSAGRSAMLNLTSITEERFLEVNDRLVYWGEGFLAARNQQVVVAAVVNEVSEIALHLTLICGADHFGMTRTLLETFLDRMCFEKIELLPPGTPSGDA
jgi:hypothetical protein